MNRPFEKPGGSMRRLLKPAMSLLPEPSEIGIREEIWIAPAVEP
jgi:hypothetical protein